MGAHRERESVMQHDRRHAMTARLAVRYEHVIDDVCDEVQRDRVREDHVRGLRRKKGGKERQSDQWRDNHRRELVVPPYRGLARR